MEDLKEQACNQIEMRCKGCVFITNIEQEASTKQIGCRLGRSDVLCPDSTGETDEDGNFSFVFDRFCNCYRPKAWADRLSADVIQEEEVLEEVVPRVGLFLIFDKSFKEQGIAKLLETIGDVKSQTLSKFRYVVVLNPDVAYNQEIQEILADSFDFEQTEYHLIQVLSDNVEPYHLDDAIGFAKNGWVLVTTIGQNIPHDFIEKMNNRINRDLLRTAIIKPYDGLNGLVFQSSLYKFLDGNKRVIHSETGEEIPFSFLDRVNGMEQSDDNIVSKWEDFVNDPS